MQHTSIPAQVCSPTAPLINALCNFTAGPLTALHPNFPSSIPLNWILQQKALIFTTRVFALEAFWTVSATNRPKRTLLTVAGSNPSGKTYLVRTLSKEKLLVRIKLWPCLHIKEKNIINAWNDAAVQAILLALPRRWTDFTRDARTGFCRLLLSHGFVQEMKAINASSL